MYVTSYNILIKCTVKYIHIYIEIEHNQLSVNYIDFQCMIRFIYLFIFTYLFMDLLDYVTADIIHNLPIFI